MSIGPGAYDPHFDALLLRAVQGTCPVYGLVVEASRLKPFDPNHDVMDTEDGRQMVQAIINQWQAGRPQQPWVYPCGEDLIVADDYATLAAITVGRAKTVACQCLGTPEPGTFIDCVGPLEVDVVRRMMGLKA